MEKEVVKNVKKRFKVGTSLPSLVLTLAVKVLRFNHANRQLHLTIEPFLVKEEYDAAVPGPAM